MGEVFLAHDDRLDRRVAIKRLLPEADTAPDRRERFRREARLAARINHSSVVQIHDILQESESDYLVMELVEGQTLREMLRHGPLEVRQVLVLARELAGGLEAAHRAGIVHRDLKTENILVPPSGTPKITDFGIAKRFLDEDGGGGETSLTSADVVVGTCRAMSPEQARGEPVDHQTDLFAFGVLLYETLTGRSPFEAASRLTTLSRVVLHRQAPVHQLNPAVPRQLSELIDRLLEKSPSQRPVSATEVQRELGEIAARFDSSVSHSVSDDATSAIGLTEFPTVPDLPVLAPPFAPTHPVPPRATPPRLFHLVLGIAIPLLAALSLASFLLRSGTRDLSALTAPAAGLTPARAESTFAVLRFQDRSATGESSWMSTAFPEMITDLLRIDGRISAAARQDVPLAELDLRLAGLDGLGPFRQRLDVDYLIAGSYETWGDEKLIVRFLIVDRSGRRYVSEVLPGAAPGLVQLSREIAGAIRRELGLPLPGAESRRAVEAIYADLPREAWPAYFTGLGHQYRANHEKAAELLAEVVPLAPRSPAPGRALALTLRSAGRHADAARAACRSSELAQSLPSQDRLEIAALCHEVAGRLAEARNLYEALLREYPWKQASYRLSIVSANLYDRQVDWLDDALNVLRDLRSAAPGTLRKIDLLKADVREAEILFQRDRYAEARRLAHDAAARANSLHAFVEAAIARRIEGTSLLQLKDYRAAIAPLQEACPRLAISRQESQAATCRESLVMAQFFADRTPLYDLLAESEEAYRAAGRLADVGRVLLIEALLRQARGEHAEAERLGREAEALFARIGASRELASWRLSTGTQLLSQGGLEEAQKALDQAYADFSRLEEPAVRAVALRNLGLIYALRGDLRSARHAFESAPASFSSYQLALIDAAEGRSARAVEALESLLAQEEQRNPALAAQICMDLAVLLLTDGAPGEALELARKAEKDLAESERHDLAILAQVLLVKVHLAQKDFATAAERFEAVRPRAVKSTDYQVVLEAGITSARLKGLLGDGRRREEALEDLAKIERGCEERRNVIYAFEARLAMGELLRPPQREEELEEIAREARRLGLERIARRAERMRGEG
jgi:serine/threonine protein kinase/tetratricopeptide (TPR) repeat protein